MASSTSARLRMYVPQSISSGRVLPAAWATADLFLISSNVGLEEWSRGVFRWKTSRLTCMDSQMVQAVDASGGEM